MNDRPVTNLRQPAMATVFAVLEIAIWVLGGYMLMCVVLRPPQRYIDKTVDFRTTPWTIVAVSRGPCPYPQARTFLPLPTVDWGVMYSGAHHLVERYIDGVRTLIWLGSITCVTLPLAFFFRRRSRQHRILEGRGFEIITHTK